MSCDMIAEDTLRLAGASFRIRALMIHEGASPMVGHYVAVMRRMAASDTFYVYDDATRVELLPEPIVCTMLRHGRRFRASALIYERLLDIEE